MWRRGEEDDDTEEEETDHKTAPHSLCEPAQSKGMSRFHKSHFIRKFTGKMPRPRMSPERGRAHTHFVGARAVEMQVKILQEPLLAEI